MSTNIQTVLFTEKFRPTKIDQCVLVRRVRQLLDRYNENGVADNILLYGTAGIGKTTTTRILAQGYDTLTINASLERGIDVIKESVMSFASTSSLFTDGTRRMKVIVLEECDALTPAAWDALRATIEKFASTVRFICNCNYIEKIPEPIQSRFTCIPLNPINNTEEQELLQDETTVIGKYLSAFKITYTQESLNAFIRANFPDMRTMVKRIQQFVNMGVTELTEEYIIKTFDNSDLFNVILTQGDSVKVYELLSSDWQNKAEDGIVSISRDFIEYLRQVNPQGWQSTIPEILVTCAEYIDKLSHSIDKFVTFEGLIFSIQMILRSKGILK